MVIRKIKTAISADNERYPFKVMPIGLYNAVTLFERKNEKLMCYKKRLVVVKSSVNRS